MSSSSDIPYNMQFLLGEDLKENPADPEQMRKGLDWLKEKLKETPAEEKVKHVVLHSKMGVYARIMGDLTLAEESLVQAITIVEEMGRRDQVVALNIRLGMVFQYGKNYTSAGKLFEGALKEIRQSQETKVKKNLDSVLFQLGRLKFDQGFYSEALDFFMETYEERLAKGDLELISNVEKAVNKTREKIGQVK